MSDTKLAPLGDRVIVEPLEQEETTPSGIVLPETAKEKPQKGTVIARGPGRIEDGKRVEMEVSVGDTVIYAKYAGTEFKLDGKKLLILSEKDILAKLAEAGPARARTSTTKRS
jgi:chaperonin GroES